jgi:hypothetical protein
LLSAYHYTSLSVFADVQSRFLRFALSSRELTNALHYKADTSCDVEIPEEYRNGKLKKSLYLDTFFGVMTSTTHPVRAALIGLSSSAVTSWASAAHLPALLTATGRSKITITALSNSSTEAAKSAIQRYGLPNETKAYGSPEDLAADPDIDLVICNTRVDKHFETVIPSVKAGKDVYVEWPIAAKREHINELVDAAKKSGSRVAVGLQRRWAPPVVKLRGVLNGGKGRLGKVLSSEVRAFGGTKDREILPIGLRYFAHKEVGGNQIVIGVGHGKHHHHHLQQQRSVSINGSST